MKSILLSIKPKYVADILNGKKTIEIRKNCPKSDLPITVYIYCTKDKQILSYQAIQKNHEHIYLSIEGFNDKNFDFQFMCLYQSDIKNGYGWYATERNLNGKVVAKFTLRKVEEIHQSFEIDLGSPYYYENEECLEEQACLDKLGIQDYLDMKDGYAWYIEDLVIFDEPKELKEFAKWGFSKYYYSNHDKESYMSWADKCERYHFGTECGDYRGPQSYCYVESEE